MRGMARVKKYIDRLRPGAAILLYHRVAAPQRDPQLLCVSPENFSAHLEVLRRSANVMSMRGIDAALTGGRLPRRVAAITFDDAYRDNFETARPLLAEHGMPGTFFLATGYLGQPREFWWDELDRLFLSPGELPARLEIAIGQHRFQCDLGRDRVWSDQDAAHYAQWDVTHPACPTERHRAYVELCRILRNVPVRDREGALSALRAWASDDGAPRTEYEAMTAAQAAEMARDGLCEVAAHTVNHPRLAVLGSEEQGRELADSKAQLEAITGRPVTGFSYPFGGKNDYTPDSVRAARAAGYSWACSNFAGSVHRTTDRFQMPRYLVRNWDGETFARFLAQRLQ